jgi:hypothetical protein
MNKVFLAQFPGRVRLAKVMPYASYLPQLPPIPWADNNGSLTSKWFGTLLIDMGVTVPTGVTIAPRYVLAVTQAP